MQGRRAIAITTVSTVLLAAGATAAVGGDVDVNVTIESASEALFLTHDDDPVTLLAGGQNPTFNAAGSTTVTGQLPVTTITDDRGGLTNTWAVEVSGTDLVHDEDDAYEIGAGQIHVFMDVVDVPALVALLTSSITGTAVVTGGELNVGLNRLDTPYDLLTGTTALGGGSVTFTPAIQAVIPAGTPAGTYEGTVTLTAS